MNNESLREILPEAKGRARDKAAESTGLGSRTAQKIVSIIDAADSGNAKARTLLDAVNERKKSIDKAFKEFKAA